MALGRLVQQRRHEIGLTRRELADRSEVSYPYVSQIETGERDPSLKTLRRLAEVLELPVEQLASLVSASDWALSSPPMPVRAAASYGDSVDLYREKVLPSLQRKLASVPPLVRLELLAELTREAAREASDGGSS